MVASTDDLILLYRIVWEGDMWGIFLVYGSTIAWVMCMVECFTKKEIKVDDPIELQTAKERENKKIDSDAWKFSLILAGILIFYWFRLGMDDLFTRMVFQNMYR